MLRGIGVDRIFRRCCLAFWRADGSGTSADGAAAAGFATASIDFARMMLGDRDQARRNQDQEFVVGGGGGLRAE